MLLVGQLIWLLCNVLLVGQLIWLLCNVLLVGQFKNNNVNNPKHLVLISETICMILVGKSVYFIVVCFIVVCFIAVCFIVACVKVLYFIVAPIIRGSGKIMYSVLFSDNGLVPSIRQCNTAVKPAQLAFD